jgi:hypothetical protein
MVIDDLILCSLQGFLPLQVFGIISSSSDTKGIGFRFRLLNAQVAKIFALSYHVRSITLIPVGVREPIIFANN